MLSKLSKILHAISFGLILGLMVLVFDLRRENQSLWRELVQSQYGMMSIESRKLLADDLDAGRPDRLNQWSKLLRQNIEKEQAALKKPEKNQTSK